MTATDGTLELIIRRTIAATPEFLFAAWTEPERLRAWWGPAGVVCEAAEVDLRVGEQYRIANRMLDGAMVWIAGRFEQIDPPRELIYSWGMGAPDAARERVTVRFEARARATEVIVLHERLADEPSRAMHSHGWAGCLDGLTKYSEHAAG